MKAERLTAIFFLSVIMIFMMLLPAGLINRVNEKAEMAEKAQANRVIDWKKVYPFYEDTASNSGTVQRVTYQYIKGKIEDFTSSKHLVGSMTAVELAKKYEEAIGWNITSPYEYNGIMRLSEGYLSWLSHSCNVSVVAFFISVCHPRYAFQKTKVYPEYWTSLTRMRINFTLCLTTRE